MSDNRWARNISECTANCKITCEFWEHTTQVLHAQFSFKGNLLQLSLMRFSSVAWANDSEGDAELYQAWLTDYILVDIAFTAMQYTSVIQVQFEGRQKQAILQKPSMTFWSFLDNIGGLTDLWLGISLITVLHFIMVTVPVFFRGIYRSHKSVASTGRKSKRWKIKLKTFFRLSHLQKKSCGRVKRLM